MTGFFIGLFAIAEAIRPGLQLPKLPVFVAFGISLLIDVLIAALIFKAILLLIILAPVHW